MLLGMPAVACSRIVKLRKNIGIDRANAELERPLKRQ
jgi:hypothetical protein